VVAENGASGDQCQCRYNYFVAHVPYDKSAAEAAGTPDAVNFTELNQQLEDDANSMPDDIKNALAAACPENAGPTPATTEAQTSTSIGTTDTTGQ
jgi:hypothetical protein